MAEFPNGPINRETARRLDAMEELLRWIANLDVAAPLFKEPTAEGPLIGFYDDGTQNEAYIFNGPVTYNNGPVVINSGDWNFFNSTGYLYLPQTHGYSQNAVWIVPGSCTLYYYCDNKVKQVTATNQGGGGGGGGSPSSQSGNVAGTTTAALVQLLSISIPSGIVSGKVALKITTNIAKFYLTATDVYGGTYTYSALTASPGTVWIDLATLTADLAGSSYALFTLFTLSIQDNSLGNHAGYTVYWSFVG